MKLTLAVIAGNAERYIGRFLDHFQSIADEVIVVLAQGSQPQDDTHRVAFDRGCRMARYDNKDWCKPDTEGGVYLDTHYANNPKDWPHVDDFAAARNMAFDMATGDWVMWADMDDLIDAASIAAIRDALERMPEDCDGLEVAYEVPEDGVTVFRERVIRRGSARWVSPIHEHLLFKEGAKLARITNAKILHAPEGSRRTNDERNLRILESIPKDERTNSHRFHLFQSLRAVGRLDEAAAEVVDLLANPPEGMGKAERFELFIAAGQMASDISTRSNLILQALGTDPARREAYGEMALCMIGMGRPAEALGFTTAMRAISKPLEGDWNARGKYYGWLGENIHGMALRANGRIEEANAVENNHFIRHGAKISLLHATRGRVKKAAECRRKWLESAADPDSVEHIFGLDMDDPDVMLLTVYNHVFLAGDCGPVAAWNAAAKASSGQILVQLSDDWEPVQGWDTAILSAIGDTSKPAVLAVSDGHRKDDLLCMAILTRARYKQQGYLFHPEFFSMFSDNWFSRQAFADGVVIDARDRIAFEHVHPAFGKSEMDATYERSNASENYERGGKAFHRLASGITLARDIDGWCDYSPFYRALAQALPEGGTFVEIGSWMGQSISVFCQEIQDFGKTAKLWCVDTFKGEQNQPSHLAVVGENGGSIREVFERNTKATGAREMIEVIEGDSAESAAMFDDGSLDAIYIDAAHDYESVVKDLAAWYPKLKPQGIFSGHDYPHWEVKQAVDEHAAANGYTVEKMGRVWMKTKVKP